MLETMLTKPGESRTGTVYKTFGLAFPAGQFSRISRSELDTMPLASVATSKKKRELSKGR